MSKEALFVLLVSFVIPQFLFAQVGRRSSFDFINLTPSARLLALGGENVSTMDEDIIQGSQNPALIADTASRYVGLSYSSFLGSMPFGYAGYSQTFEGVGSFHTGILYSNSGAQKQTDPYGNILGEFSSSQFMWIVGYSRAWKRFRYGANFKVISSTLAPGYSSFGLALDLGGSYSSKDKLFTAGLVFRNIGYQFTTYTASGERGALPFQIIGGVSNKFKYMPLRFSATIIRIETPVIIYVDPNETTGGDFGQEAKPKNRTADKIFSHFVFSAEFLLGKALRLRAGYNYLRNYELRSEKRSGMTGFSLGAGVKLKWFSFDYGFSAYGASSAFQAHQFGILFKV